ncbi:hypothetical protein GW17_00028659 [Ensete ventricosum]|nr:hypothetical protein GW17_00028659 [Ensete ventricosum]
MIPIQEVRRQLEQRKMRSPSSPRLRFCGFFFAEGRRSLRPLPHSLLNAVDEEMKEIVFFSSSEVTRRKRRRFRRGSHMMEQYKGARLGELSPHVFAVADASYRAMMHEVRSQSILVSGESGAGKTETTKLIMQYLTYVGGRAANDDRTVEQQVLEVCVFPLVSCFSSFL